MTKVKFNVYWLQFTSPVHFGDAMDDYGRSLGTYHSDSLYAALTSALASAGWEVPGGGDAGFSITSLFPYANVGNDKVYFFPKPLLHARMPREKLKQHKILKKIKWVDARFFERLLAGEGIFELAEPDKVQSKEYLSNKVLPPVLSEAWVAARVKVPRYNPADEIADADARPYYIERIQFAEGAGLYFIAMGEQAGLEMLEKGLQLLSDHGLGTDRNVGHGHFVWGKDELHLSLPGSDHLMCLGMYIPEKELVEQKILHEQLLAYKLARRGGWITDAAVGTYRKNDIHALEPGSVIRHSSIAGGPVLRGRMADLTPKADFIRQALGHPIYRNGQTICLPIKIH